MKKIIEFIKEHKKIIAIIILILILVFACGGTQGGDSPIGELRRVDLFWTVFLASGLAVLIFD